MNEPQQELPPEAPPASDVQAVKPPKTRAEKKAFRKLVKRLRHQRKDNQQAQEILKARQWRSGERAVRKMAEDKFGELVPGGKLSGRQWRKLRKRMQRRAKQSQPFKRESVKLADSLFEAGKPVYREVKPSVDAAG